MRSPLFLMMASSILTAASMNALAAESQECREIKKDKARLACYDSLFGSPELAAMDSDVTSEAKIEVPPENEVSDLEVRIKSEKQLADNRFVITPHKQTYILPYSYVDDPNSQPYQTIAALTDDQHLDHEEVKFQISFKVPLFNDFLIDDTTLWAGYTQVSLWQAYNNDASAPFRETNYEPEIYWSFPTEANVFGATLEEVSLGFVHQSNGRSEELSRSWNRVYANFVLARSRWAFGFKPWYRIPENESNDDNPDIEKYLGYADFIGTYKWDNMVFSAQLRNNLRSTDNHTSSVLSLSFPLPGRLNGYVEYVDGYGETLIDYNHRNQRIGIGFILNDWY